MGSVDSRRCAREILKRHGSDKTRVCLFFFLFVLNKKIFDAYRRVILESNRLVDALLAIPFLFLFFYARSKVPKRASVPVEKCINLVVSSQNTCRSKLTVHRVQRRAPRANLSSPRSRHKRSHWCSRALSLKFSALRGIPGAFFLTSELSTSTSRSTVGDQKIKLKNKKYPIWNLVNN